MFENSAEPADAGKDRGRGADAADSLRRFVADQRQAAEAFLSEVSALSEMLERQERMERAVRDYTAAREKADGEALLAREASGLSHTATDRRRAVAEERRRADELLAAATVEAQQAIARVGALEGRLEDARRQAADAAVSLEHREARAKELIEKEAAAALAEAEALKHVEELQLLREAAISEARAAQERAEALNRESVAALQNVAEIETIQNLAARIAQGAFGTTPGQGQPKPKRSDGDKLLRPNVARFFEGNATDRARRAYPMHPNRRKAFLAGWKACAAHTASDESIALILSEYAKGVVSTFGFETNERTIAAMRGALEAVQSGREE